MESALCLTPDEARTYSKILDAVAVMPKSDPRFALIIGITWWLLHRRRRLEQQRIRRRQFFRRWRRLVLLRWQLQKNALTGVSSNNIRATELAALQELSSLPEKRLWMTRAQGHSHQEEDLWAKIENGEISALEFSKKFHMTKETFDFIYGELAENLNKSSAVTGITVSLPGKKRLAATIYRIANNAEYLKVSSLFGIGKSTTMSLLRDVCEIIVLKLKDKYLNWKMAEESLEEKLVKSEITFGIPQCVGVLASLDVFITDTSWDSTQATQYSSSYSRSHALVFQAVVDHESKFTHVVAKSPGGLSNTEVLQNSGLPTIFKEKFGLEMEKFVNDVKVPALLAGDRSYTLQDWLVTPYNLKDKKKMNEENELDKRCVFNEKMSRAQKKFEDVIKKMKVRWKIFHGKGGKISFSIEAFEIVAMSCCILHNICEMRGDNVLDVTWSADVLQNELSLRIQSKAVDSSFISEERAAESSKEIRDALAARIFEKNELLKGL